jgi:hypothetical protein
MASEFGLDLTSVVSKREAIDLLFSNVDINDPSFIGAVQGAMDKTICASTFEPEEVYEWIAYRNPNWTDAVGNIWHIEIAGDREAVEEIVNNINLIALPIESDELENDFSYEPDGQGFPVDLDQPESPIPSVRVHIELNHLESDGAHRVFFNLDPDLSRPKNPYHHYSFNLNIQDGSADLRVQVSLGVVNVALYSTQDSKSVTLFTRTDPHHISAKGQTFGLRFWLPDGNVEGSFSVDGDYVILK